MRINDFQSVARKVSGESDVVIVGAGIAGLSAALQLVDKANAEGRKLSITILEAANEIGGRTKTQTIDGFPVNTGAHWFHGGEDNPMFQWIKTRYPQLETSLDDVSSQNSVGQGQTFDHGFRAGNLKMMEKAYSEFKEQNPGKDVSLTTIAKLTGDAGAAETARFFARCWMAEDDTDKVSADEFFGCPYGAGGGQIKGGVTKVVALMKQELEAAGVKIQTGCKVSSVEQTAEGVTLTDADGKQHKAGRAVVTLPIGVLQKNGVTFDPPLSPDTRKYIDDTSVSHFTKIIIPVDPKFFETHKIAENTHIDILDKETFCHCRTEGKPFITLMTGGQEAVAVEKMSRAELKAYVEASLDCVPLLQGWRSAVTGTPEVTGWNTNPLELGAYTAMKIGQSRKDPVQEGRVTVCGEAFAGEKDVLEGPSMMVGAWFSGRKAADAIYPALANSLTATPATKSAQSL